MELMKVALTNLGKYNEGELVFKWLALPTTEEEIKNTLKEIGINEEYEEYFISDYMSDYGLDCGEYSNVIGLNDFCKSLSEFEDEEKLEAILDSGNYTTHEEILEAMISDDVYFVAGVTGADYMEELVEECYNLDFNKLGSIASYIHIDYEAMFRDEYNMVETENGVLVDNR